MLSAGPNDRLCRVQVRRPTRRQVKYPDRPPGDLRRKSRDHCDVGTQVFQGRGEGGVARCYCRTTALPAAAVQGQRRLAATLRIRQGRCLRQLQRTSTSTSTVLAPYGQTWAKGPLACWGCGGPHMERNCPHVVNPDVANLTTRRGAFAVSNCLAGHGEATPDETATRFGTIEAAHREKSTYMKRTFCI